jgi:cyclic-di-AMP phosphodiesterase PgpH
MPVAPEPAQRAGRTPPATQVQPGSDSDTRVNAMDADVTKRIAAVLAVKSRLKWILLVGVGAVFLLVLHPRLIVHHPSYAPGDIAARDIKAPRDFLVEDPAATTASQLQAAEQVLTVYDHDPRIAAQLTERIRAAFGKMRGTLNHLQVPAAADAPSRPAGGTRKGAVASAQQEIEKVLLAHKESFEAAIGIEINRGAFRLLINESFSSAIAETIINVVDTVLSNGVVANKEVLLKEVEKGITLRDVSTQTEKTFHSLRQFYGPDQSKNMVRIAAEPHVKEMNYNLVNLIVDLSQRLIHPNITLNHNETEERKKQALKEVKPILYQIKAGEMLLREGERVSELHLLKLHALQSQTGDRFSTSSAGAVILLSILLIVCHYIYFHQSRDRRLADEKNLLLMAMSLTAVLVMAKVGVILDGSDGLEGGFSLPADAILFAVPVAAASMLICLMLGFGLALPFSLLAAVCAALLVNGRIEFFVFYLVGGAMGAFWVQRCRERKVVIRAGFKLGLLNAATAMGIIVYNSSYGGMTPALSALMAFAGGITCGIITLGIAPLVEMAFKYTTDITLLELANLDRPLLRQLMIEVPGTYHHSVIVGSMVEAAASEIGANPLLAKVCGYYHDIGKLKKPLYFIENQTDGRNRHDKLAPSMSSLILIAHVKDGVELAQKHHLGQIISDTIEQHHGTSLIHYFFEKAKQLKGEDAVKFDDYRYPGPKPQTKEAGLVMLADVVEAASRTLDNPTPARIQGMVQHLINKVFSDGQLDNCELTLKDLHSIAKSFYKILNGIHHHRIEYTDVALKESVKVKHVHPDRQSAPKPAGRDPDRAKEGPGHLKRLGMS